MRVTWQFRLVRYDGRSGFVNRAGEKPPFEGSVQEALQFAERIRAHFQEETSVRRVEAWSSPPLDEAVAGYEPFTITRHENGRDWRLLPARLTHPGWFKSLMDAVDYAAFRGRGHVSQIRVMTDKTLEKLILCPQTGMDPFAAGARLSPAAATESGAAM